MTKYEVETSNFRDNPQLQCEVARMEYDFAKRQGTLHMREGDCCDMAGCIAWFEVIDPAVARIDTYSGAAPDTRYVLSNGVWASYSPPEGQQTLWQRWPSDAPSTVSVKNNVLKRKGGAGRKA